MFTSVLNRLNTNWIVHLPSGEGQVALTFDDGPDERTTWKILASLHQLKIKASFFVVGEKCRGNDCLLKRIGEENHLLVNHGFVHRRHFYLSASQQAQSILKTHECLESLQLDHAAFFRPPYGSFNLSTPMVLKHCGYRGILWSVMIGDWKKQDQEIVWKRLKHRLHDGAIIVLHDSVAAVQNVLFVLPRLAEEVDKRNWKFVKLDEGLRDAVTGNRIRPFIPEPS